MTREEQDLHAVADRLGEDVEVVELTEVGVQTDRLQRSRQAGLDQYGTPGVDHYVADAIDVAVETAIRVRVDDVVLAAFANELTRLGILTNITNGAARAGMQAAFAAAGFEVEQ